MELPWRHQIVLVVFVCCIVCVVLILGWFFRAFGNGNCNSVFFSFRDFKILAVSRLQSCSAEPRLHVSCFSDRHPSVIQRALADRQSSFFLFLLLFLYVCFFGLDFWIVVAHCVPCHTFVAHVCTFSCQEVVLLPFNFILSIP